MSNRGLHTTTFGDSGQRVYFLHGLFGQGKNWTSIAKALLAGGDFRITLVDLPNHGRSAWTTDLDYPALADAVADLFYAQGNEPVALVGHSMGGKIAMALTLQHPDVIDRLCVVDVSPVPYDTASGFAEYVAGLRSLDLAKLPDRTAADAGLIPYVPDPVARSFLLQNLRRAPAGSDTAWQWQMNLKLLGDRLDDLGLWPAVDRSPYPGPVLWIAGQNSRYIRPEYAPAMRELFPRVRLVTIKNAGHWVHSEQPQIFTSVLDRFLRAG